MPQLDKYIFCSQIISLTIFFFFIYIYVRSVIIPKLSLSLKYRKTKLESFNNEINYYNKHINNIQVNKLNKGNELINFSTRKLVDFIYTYNKCNLIKLNHLHTYNIKDIRYNSKNLINFKKELKRINLLLSS